MGCRAEHVGLPTAEAWIALTTTRGATHPTGSRWSGSSGRFMWFRDNSLISFHGDEEPFEGEKT